MAAVAVTLSSASANAYCLLPIAVLANRNSSLNQTLPDSKCVSTDRTLGLGCRVADPYLNIVWHLVSMGLLAFLWRRAETTHGQNNTSTNTVCWNSTLQGQTLRWQEKGRASISRDETGAILLDNKPVPCMIGQLAYWLRDLGLFAWNECLGSQVPSD